jgi:hypothetical protein
VGIPALLLDSLKRPATRNSFVGKRKKDKRMTKYKVALADAGAKIQIFAAFKLIE